MFQFASPQYLYGLFILPLLVLIFLRSQWMAHRRESRFGRRHVLKQLVSQRSKTRPIVKFSLLCLAVVLGILLLARPQYGTNDGSEKRKGIEAVIAFDVSQSMLAQDVQPSRIERSKLLVSTLIDRMENDKIGLVVFAGEAFPQLPITNDFVSAQLFLDNISTDAVSLQGTNLTAAITLAGKSFTQDKRVGKAIIIITDGENHEPGAKEAALAAAKAGQHVYVLGVGSREGAEIPTTNGPLRDRSGGVVKTALNESACRELAEAGNGAYIHIDGSNVAQDQLQAQLRKLQQTDSGMASDGNLNEQFQAVALLLFIVLLIELILFEKQNTFFSRFRIFQHPA